MSNAASVVSAIEVRIQSEGCGVVRQGLLIVVGLAVFTAEKAVDEPLVCSWQIRDGCQLGQGGDEDCGNVDLWGRGHQALRPASQDICGRVPSGLSEDLAPA